MWNKIIEWVGSEAFHDDATLIIACFAFVLSLWNALWDLYKNHKNLKINVQNLFICGPGPNGEYVNVLNIKFVNKSREPITLSGLELNTSDERYKFGEYRLRVFEGHRRVGSTEVSRYELFSDVFPVTVPGLGCAHMLLSSTSIHTRILSNKPYKLVLSTNKGRIRKRFLSGYSNGELLSECREPSSYTLSTR